MARGEVPRPLPRSGRPRTPVSPMAKITSPRNVYTDAEPRYDLQYLRPKPGASQISSIPHKPVKLSLIPPTVQQGPIKPKNTPVPLLDAAAALRYQNGNGMALGNSSYGPYSGASTTGSHAMSSAPFSAVPNSFSATPYSPVSSPEGIDDGAHPRSGRWKVLGGFFHKKLAPGASLPTPPAEAPAILPSQSASTAPPSRRPEVAHHRRQTSRSLEVPRIKPESALERPKDFPNRVQKPRTLVKSPSLRRPPPIPAAAPSRPSPTLSLDKPMPPTPNGERERRPAVPPKLQVDIPDFQMERYSVMFGNVLNARQSSLMVRRQAQLERLKLREANEGLARDESLLDKAMPELPKEWEQEKPVAPKEETIQENTLEVPAFRRATLPSPTKSPSYSLFPPPSIRGNSPAPKSGSPMPLQRAWTSPALSPGLESPRAKSKAPEKTAPKKVEKLPPRPAEKARDISGPKVPEKIEKAFSKAFESAVESPSKPTDGARRPVEAAKAMAKAVEKPVAKLVEKAAAATPIPEKPIEKALHPTITEECEEFESSPIADSPPTPKNYSWEPEVSPRPNRSTSLGESETDPREQSGDIIIQIAAEPAVWSPPIPEPREGAIELLGTPVYEMPPPLPQAKPAPPITPLADLTADLNEPSPLPPTKPAALPAPQKDLRASLNKPLPTPSADPRAPSPHKQSVLTAPRLHSDEVDWHVVSPRNASLPAPTQTPHAPRNSSLPTPTQTQHAPRKASLSPLPVPEKRRPDLTPISTEAAARKATSPPSAQDVHVDSPRAPRRPSVAVKPPARSGRELPPRTTIGRGSVSNVASLSRGESGASRGDATSRVDASRAETIRVDTSSANPTGRRRSSNSAASPATNTPTSSTLSPSSTLTTSPTAPSVASPASTGPMPNPLASAPTSAAEISIARKISISRRQQMMVPIVPKTVRPPQHAQLVVPLDTSPTSGGGDRKFVARKSHHVLLETA